MKWNCWSIRREKNERCRQTKGCGISETTLASSEQQAAAPTPTISNIWILCERWIRGTDGCDRFKECADPFAGWWIWQRSRQGPTETSKHNHLNVPWCGTLDTLPRAAPTSSNITEPQPQPQTPSPQNHHYRVFAGWILVTSVPIQQNLESLSLLSLLLESARVLSFLASGK
jgi:hypothetical protein